MSTEIIEKEPIPSPIRYMTLLSSGLIGLTTLSAAMDLPKVGTAGQNFLQLYIPISIGLTIFTLGEFLLQRRNRKWLGAAGFSVGLEAIKFYLYRFALYQQYQSQVGTAALSTFDFISLLSLLSIGSIAVSNVFREKIELLAQKQISKTLLSLLPTFIILGLFLGTYFVEIAGIGPVRQLSDTNLPYEPKNINWSLFNTPTWNTKYLFEDLLGQFTSGLNPDLLDTPLFNVTNLIGSDPTAPQAQYWRFGTLNLYQFVNKEPYTPDWEEGESSIVFSRSSSFFSQDIPESERSALFEVELQLDTSEEFAHYTVISAFEDHLPTIYSPDYGTYIDQNSIQIQGATVQSIELKEKYVNVYPNDVTGIQFSIATDASTPTSLMKYQTPYKEMDVTLIYTAGKREDYKTILDEQSYQTLASVYLQLPNRADGTLPETGYVRAQGGTVTLNSYADWAPTVYKYAQQWNDSSLNVYMQALTDADHLSPLGSSGPNPQFNESLWLGQFVGQEVDHPNEYEDYNEWFLQKNNGVSLHFASALATILRLQKIPSRVVVGYAMGDTDLSNGAYRTFTPKYMHAWVEILVPFTIGGTPTLKWVVVDPIASALLASFAQQSTVYKIFDPLNVDLTNLANAQNTPGWTEFPNNTNPTNGQIPINEGVKLYAGLMSLVPNPTFGTVVPNIVANHPLSFYLVSSTSATPDTDPLAIKVGDDVYTNASGVANIDFVFNASIASKIGFPTKYLYVNTTYNDTATGQLQTLSAVNPNPISFVPAESSPSVPYNPSKKLTTLSADKTLNTRQAGKLKAIKIKTPKITWPTPKNYARSTSLNYNQIASDFNNPLMNPREQIKIPVATSNLVLKKQKFLMM